MQTHPYQEITRHKLTTPRAERHTNSSIQKSWRHTTHLLQGLKTKNQMKKLSPKSQIQTSRCVKQLSKNQKAQACKYLMNNQPHAQYQTSYTNHSYTKATHSQKWPIWNLFENNQRCTAMCKERLQVWTKQNKTENTPMNANQSNLLQVEHNIKSPKKSSQSSLPACAPAFHRPMAIIVAPLYFRFQIKKPR